MEDFVVTENSFRSVTGNIKKIYWISKTLRMHNKKVYP